jgi:esterase/lipase
MKQSYPPQNNSWYYSTLAAANGVFLVGHGLNLNPLAMRPLIHSLNNLGFHCYLLVLEGHNVSKEGGPDKEQISLATWLSDFEKAVSEIRSKFPGLPLLNLSYSLGAALSILYQDIKASRIFSAHVLLAPAIKLTTISKLLKPIATIKRLDFSLPSFAPKRYRAFPFTPIAEYRALFEISKRLEKIAHPEVLNDIPTTVYLSPLDELVDFSATKEWILKNNLWRWEFREIKSRKAGPLDWHHIIIDKESLREHGWSFLLKENSLFLQRNMFFSQADKNL